MPKVIISLTSFPKAIDYAIGAIRSLLNGTVLPDKLVLYLTYEQFRQEGVPIPQELLNIAQSSPIFEIRDYSTDLRSYRKLIPALHDFPDDIIVTVDDDVKYRPKMLEKLLLLHDLYPRDIIAHRAKLIKPGRPYRKWRKYRWYHFLFKQDRASLLNLPTGVAGVLYPPHSLAPDMLDPALFTRIAPTTDDVWFWAAATANGTKVRPVPFGQNKPKGLPKPKDLSLKTVNFKGKKDNNLEALNAILQAFPKVKERIETDF